MDGTELSKAGNHTARPAIGVDVARYQAMLDASEASDAQKEEFLQQLWLVVLGLVDLGLEVHPVQLACGQINKITGPAATDQPSMLGYTDQLRDVFEDASGALRRAGAGEESDESG